MLRLIALLAAGGLGTLARYGLAVAMRSHSIHVPLGTVVANALGCFLFGWIFEMFSLNSAWNPEIRLILLVGFMGAFTTFSSFAFETIDLLQQGAFLRAFIYWTVQNLSGLILTVLGIALARSVA